MSLGLLTNVSSIYAQNNLNQTQQSLQNTLTQLSSGSRINSGADDAAGLAVADGLHANESALSQSTRNASDGIGLLQTADGALSQVTNLLNRAVTLATESANGTLNTNQVSAANQEYQNILSEIGNIGSTTNYNGNSVFTAAAKTVFVSDGTSTGANSFSETIGTLSAGGVGIAPPSVTSTALTPSTPSTPTSGAASTATLTLSHATDTFGGNLSITYGGGSAVNLTIGAGTTIAQLATQINGAGITGLSATVGTGSNANVLTISGTAGASNTISFTGSAVTDNVPGTTNGAGVNFSSSASTNVSQLTSATASTVLTSVTSAIADVAYQRGLIGAQINQLTAASNVASSEEVNLTSAESNIRSTDYGQATSDLAKYQVLSQTGISAVAQANSVQQEVLKLLQG